MVGPVDPTAVMLQFPRLPCVISAMWKGGWHVGNPQRFELPMSALQEDEELGELTAEERAGIDAAHASAVAAGVAPMDVSHIHTFATCYETGSVWLQMPGFC